MSYIDQKQVEPNEVIKFLGVHIDNKLKFGFHVDSVCAHISSGIFLLRRLPTFVDNILLTAYYGLIYPLLSYAIVIWGNETSKTQFLFELQKKALRAVFKKPYRHSCKPIFKDNQILTFPSIYIFHCVMFIRRNPNLFAPVFSVDCYDLRIRPKHFCAPA